MEGQLVDYCIIALPPVSTAVLPHVLRKLNVIYC